MWRFGLVLVFALYPSSAYAYVDPGFLSVVYQFVYVAVFGVLATFIFKPWRFIRSFISKLISGKRTEREKD